MLILPSSILTPNWRTYTLFFLAIATLIGNIAYFIIVETPKYNYIKHKQLCIDSINIINKINNGESAKIYTTNDLIEADSNFSEKATQNSKEVKTYSYMWSFIFNR